ncbi:MAG: hypothetical protein PF450_03955 [Bacteroidales bacterium]|jgi:hypothetical protein|nr:hypothetical protein [Bacteroidales bacterium]
MKNQGLLTHTANYCIIVGILYVFFWSFLIISASTTDFTENPIAYIFHWISEFGTSFLLIISGLLFRRSNSQNLNFIFVSLGALMISSGNAFVYYLLHFEVLIFIFITILTGATIIFLILNYRSLKHFIFVANGISLYALLNILGEGLQEMNISLISMSAPAFIFIFILTITLLDKDVVFKYMKGNILRQAQEPKSKK